MKKGDWGILMLLCLLLVASLFPHLANRGRSALRAEFWQDGVLLHTFDLASEGERTVGQHHRIAWEKGKIRILSSDCPDQDCVRIGWLEHPGASSICLPYRTVLRIPQGKQTAEETLDAVAH